MWWLTDCIMVVADSISLLAWLVYILVLIWMRSLGLLLLSVVCCLLSVVYCYYCLWLLVLGFQYYWLVAKPPNCCSIHLHFTTPVIRDLSHSRLRLLSFRLIDQSSIIREYLSPLIYSILDIYIHLVFTLIHHLCIPFTAPVCR